VAPSATFGKFRKAILRLIASDRGTRRCTGSDGVEIPGKRLFSCSVAFADPWRSCKVGLAEEQTAAEAVVQAAWRDFMEDIGF